MRKGVNYIKNISKIKIHPKTKKVLLHRPERKMRQNVVMICIFYNYVSSNLTNVPLLFSYLKY